VEEALPKLKVMPGEEFELLPRDCWPDSSTSDGAETAKQSRKLIFAAIPSGAWCYFGAEGSVAGKRDAAVALRQAGPNTALCLPIGGFAIRVHKIRDSTPNQKHGKGRLASECQSKSASYAKMQIAVVNWRTSRCQPGIGSRFRTTNGLWEAKD